MTFGSPETAGLAAGSTNPVSLIQQTTLTVNSLGSATFPELDVSAYAGVIVTLNHASTTGAAGVLFASPVFADASGNQMALGTNNIPTLVSWVKPAAGGASVGFGGLYYRTLARFMRVVVQNFDGSGNAAVTCTVFGTNMPGRFDGPYCSSVNGLVVSGTTDTLASGGNAVHVPQNTYTGPAIVNFRSDNAAAAGFATLDLIDTLTGFSFFTLVTSGQALIGLSAPAWIIGRPWTVNVGAGGVAQTLRASVVAA